MKGLYIGELTIQDNRENQLMLNMIFENISTLNISNIKIINNDLGDIKTVV